MKIKKLDRSEVQIVRDYEKGRLREKPLTKEIEGKFRAAAKATPLKDRRVNIRLSSADLSDLQDRAMEEGLPYQTMISSILHKYITGRLTELPPRGKKSGNPQGSPISRRPVKSEQ